ncbi:hypothetical protein PLCT2_01711 [Planctomycetaceae bacterium]|nr:hypothetical protein PLCT2_01711 [Planctomycetaceae bacterium]
MSNGHLLAVRHSRRGGILMVSVGFVVAVSLAGTILLSLSYMHQVDMQQKALAVRMMAAAEAGIESKRGRFTLVAGVQDDWATLLPTAGWNNVDAAMSINGLSVQVQASPTGSFSVPKARIRGVVTTAGRRLAVEYEIKVPQFSDYSVFSGSTAVYNPGVNYKSVGNHYSRGDIFIAAANTGVEFFGKTETSGVANTFGPEGGAYNYKQTPITNVAPRTIDFSAVNFTVPRARAVTLNMLYKENTIAIHFNGNGTFTRTYVRRLNTAAANDNLYPTSNAWINTGTGAIIGANLTNSDYDVATETVTLAAESVIFIEEGAAGTGDRVGGANSNNYVQVLHQATNYTQGWATGATSVWSRQQRKVLLLSGTLGTGDRATVVSAGNIMTVVRDCIKYQYLLNNPSFRNANNKSSAGALAFTEMLGVISNTDINFAWEWWTALTAAQECPVAAGGGTSSVSLGQPGQHCIDGNFAAVNASCPGNIINGTGRDLWFCGGNGGNAVINSGFGNIYSPGAFAGVGARHYDWDWRLNDTAPPYYLRTYNTSARFITGTWRSYEF